MKTLLSFFKKTAVICICFFLFSSAAKATIYTALLSGDFNAAATWGGVVPPALISTDVVIIPPGITVTLTSDQGFTATSSLSVNGTLTSGTYASSLSLTGGTLAGTGAIQLDSLVLNMTSGISYTGSIVAQNLISQGASITAATNITVNNTLTLAMGAMDVAAGSLTMSSGSAIVLTGGTLSATGIGTINLANPYSVTYMTSSAVTGVELTGAGLGSVTVDVTGSVTMANNATLHGLLSLTSGMLMISDNTLTLGTGADLSPSGTGTLSGTLNSSLTIATSGSLTGSLMFASGGNVLNNLTLNMAGSRSVVSLGSDLTLNNSLNLMSGMLTIDTNDLAINPGGMINGGSSSSYVVANSSGSLIMNLVAGDIDTFKIGTSVNFAPIVVSAASGSSTGNVSVNIIGQVYEDGTSGTVISATNSMVSATWFVSSDASGAINYSLTAVWDTSMEVNGFDRTQAYISHYTGGGWDIQPLTASASVGAGMYSMTRTGITSLSPFRVADKYSSTFTPDVSLNTDVIVYPNPATSTLNFTQGDKINSVEIYNLLGEVNTFSHLDNNSVSVLYLASGVYFAHFTGDGINTIITFIKQ